MHVCISLCNTMQNSSDILPLMLQTLLRCCPLAQTTFVTIIGKPLPKISTGPFEHFIIILMCRMHTSLIPEWGLTVCKVPAFIALSHRSENVL